MSNDNLTPEYRLVMKAKLFESGQLRVENEKTASLLRKIAAHPEEWALTYGVFGTISWSSEIFAMGLNREEQHAVRDYLERAGILNIRLENTEAYKALAISGIESLIKRLDKELQRRKNALEEQLKAVVRFAPDGFTVSGYKRGWPFTSYSNLREYYHKVYIDRTGKFEVVNNSNESSLPKDDEMIFALYAVERSMDELRECWNLWNRKSRLEERLHNLDKHSNSNGALG